MRKNTLGFQQYRSCLVFVVINRKRNVESSLRANKGNSPQTLYRRDAALFDPAYIAFQERLAQPEYFRHSTLGDLVDRKKSVRYQLESRHRFVHQRLVAGNRYPTDLGSWKSKHFRKSVQSKHK